MSKTDNTVARDSMDRQQNAKRYGKLGVFVGFFAAMLSGGGWAGVIPIALAGGAIGALGGAAAGDKINPVIDKLTGFLPSQKKRNAEQAAQAPAQEQYRAPLSSEQDYAMLDTLNNADLQNMRAEVEANLRKAGIDMDPNAEAVRPGLPDEWVSRNAAGKHPTHEAPAIRQ